MKIEKTSLPKGMSYPLKSSFLIDALSAADIEIDAHLILSPGGIFFDAYFWPPNPNVTYERLYVRAGAVPAGESEHVRRYLQSSVIPELLAWIRGILVLPANSPVRREQQAFAREFPKRQAGF